MSKRTKVITGLLIIVLVIGGGVFGYFISSGKIKLHVSQAPVSNSTVRLTNTVTVNYNYSNDPGSFTKMSVKNLTANRGTNGYGALQAKRGDVLQYRVTLRSNINKLYNPFIYNGLEDPNNTNFKETMSFSTVSPGWGYSFSPSNAGSIPTYMTSSVGMAYSTQHYLGGYNKTAIGCELSGQGSYLNQGSTFSVYFAVKVKNTATIGARVKNGWAAGWVDYKYTQIWSGNGKYGFTYVQIVQ